MKSYQLTSTGRRITLVLLVTALIVWAIAIWTLRNTVGSVADTPDRGFFAALQQNVQRGMGISQLVPALLMLTLIVTTPLVCWNLLEAYSATYTPDDKGLRFTSLGIGLTYPWQGMRGLRITGDGDERADEIQFDRDYTGQIGNPLLRLLHVQAYGRRALLIPADLAQRDALLAEIATRTGFQQPTASSQQPAQL